MVNNSDGLTPTLRPQLGVGWNRALPSPFGFDNGFRGNTTNNSYLYSPLAVGKIMPQNYSAELFFKVKSNGTSCALFSLNIDAGSSGVMLGSATQLSAGTNNETQYTQVVDQLSYICLDYIGNIATPRVRDNPLLPISTLPNLVTTNIVGTPITGFYIGRITYYGTKYSSNTVSFDELRIYKKLLTNAQRELSYNGGRGENPPETEHLFAWYKFQEFEMLDVSLLQDNSDIRLALRDYSGNNFHMIPVNCETNPASPNYVLKPF